MLTREEAIKKHYDIKCHIAESKKILSIINQIYDDHEVQMKAKDEEIDRLKEFEEMVEWMELNSNRSLCDYYNNKDNQ